MDAINMMQFSFVVFHVEIYPRGNRMMSSCDMIGCLIVWNFCVHARFEIPANYSVAVTQTLEISLSVLPCEVISSACWNVCFYSLKSRQGARLHEPRLAGWVAIPGPPFSSQKPGFM